MRIEAFVVRQRKLLKSIFLPATNDEFIVCSLKFEEYIFLITTHLFRKKKLIQIDVLQYFKKDCKTLVFEMLL